MSMVSDVFIFFSGEGSLLAAMNLALLPFGSTETAGFGG